ncbi:hypothetical protein HMI49_04005 [Corallococcus exercitus]|uniref:Uncharacterized protein n=1 Tax=Corallococcus exercitus TaxID=2316736 RepID=A0A7Y4NPH5_9BACT|nr:hypothetical protein [Corallococcus exercitus]NOK32364.1 hypothetical protein [Corallococcus exercitus]
MAKRLPPGAKPVIDVVAGVTLGPTAATAVKFLSSVADPLLQYIGERRERRAELFVEAFMESSYPNETSAALLQAEIANAPAPTKDAIFDTLRALDDVMSDLVTPSLALLAREYVRTGRAKDKFFIGALRLLRDLSDNEYTKLKELVALVNAYWTMGGPDRFFVQKAARGESYAITLDRAETAWEPEYDALFQGLVSAGFAAVSTGLAGGPGVVEKWFIRWEPWERLTKLLP